MRAVSAALLVGAIGGATGGTILANGVLSSGAREGIMSIVGDTVAWHASVSTDMVLRVVAGRGFACLKGGNSFAFERLYVGSKVVAADTIAVTCVEPGSVSAESLAFDWASGVVTKICIVPGDTMAKYNLARVKILSKQQDSAVQEHCSSVLRIKP